MRVLLGIFCDLQRQLHGAASAQFKLYLSVSPHIPGSHLFRQLFHQLRPGHVGRIPRNMHECPHLIGHGIDELPRRHAPRQEAANWP